MNRKAIYLLITALFSVQLACGLIAAPTATPTPAQPPVDEPAPPASSLTMDQLRNHTYDLGDFASQAAFQDGQYQDGDLRAQIVEPAAFGDLDGDGQEDAAVIVVVNTGGTGRFYHLIAVRSQNGMPSQAAVTFLGDRQAVQNLAIQDGRILLDFLTQGPDDPLCCPSERHLRSYVLDNGSLNLESDQILEGAGE